jgi:hypothetical protein
MGWDLAAATLSRPFPGEALFENRLGHRPRDPPGSAPAALVCLTEIKAGRITDLSKLKNVRAEVHDRVRFTRTAEGGWLIERLAH